MRNEERNRVGRSWRKGLCRLSRGAYSGERGVKRGTGWRGRWRGGGKRRRGGEGGGDCTKRG